MRLTVAMAILLSGVFSVNAAEPTVSLKLVAKQKNYAWPVEQTPEDFDARLKELAKAVKEGKFVETPANLKIDFVLEFTNTGDQAAEIFVKGDPNLLQLDLTGPGVIALAPPRPMTLEFRLPQSVTIEPGKTFEIPLAQLADGARGIARSIYFTQPGEYELKASYRLTDGEGNPTKLAKSPGVKFTVSKPK